MEASSPNVVLIQDEKFDFDFELSDSREEANIDEDEEEEVFFGPVSHIERCVATSASIAEQQLNVASPPTGHHVEVYKEANFIANLFKKQSSSDSFTADGESFKNDAADEKENHSEVVTVVASKLVNGIDRSQSVGRAALQENNHHSPSFKGMSPAIRSTPKETKLQTPSKKKRVFSPVNVNHLYGLNVTPPTNETVQPNDETERPVNSSLLELTSSTAVGADSREVQETQDGTIETQHDGTRKRRDDSKETQAVNRRTSRSQLRPPGFGKSRTHYTASSSSTSSTSSTSSLCQENFNGTSVTRRSSSSSSQNTSFSSDTASARQPVKTKSSLKSLGNGTVKPKFPRSNDVTKSKLQPVKAIHRGKPRSTGTPANSSFSDGSTLVSARQRCSTLRSNSEVFTPVKRRESSQGTTPSKGDGGKKVTTGLPPKGQERKNSAEENGQKTMVKRRETRATQGRASSWSKTGMASPVRRRTAAPETSQSESKTKRTSLMRGGTPGNKQTTPVRATVTEPRTAARQPEEQKRASLGASRNKRRSLLPTPVSIKPTEPKCQRSRVDSEPQNASGPIPFNIPGTPQNSSASVSSSVASNLFSPLTGSNAASTAVDSNADLISLSPPVSQGDLINLGSSPVDNVPNLVDIE